LAAHIAFLEGIQSVSVMPLYGVNLNSTESELYVAFQDAINALIGQDVYYICPISIDIAVQTFAYEHCLIQSSTANKSERRAICGFPINYPIGTPSTPNTRRGVVTDFRDERISFMGPSWGKITVKNPDGTTQVLTVDGSYVAVDATTTKAIRPVPSFPNHKKQAFAFDQGIEVIAEPLNSQLSDDEGIATMEMVGTLVRINHCVTTEIDFIEANEWSIVDMLDYLAMYSRNTIEDQFINNPQAEVVILADTPLLVANSLESILTDAVTKKWITKYDPSSVKGTQPQSDPTSVQVKAKIMPLFPFNTGFIEFDVTVF